MSRKIPRLAYLFLMLAATIGLIGTTATTASAATAFDPNTITLAYLLNDADNVDYLGGPKGHNAMLLVDRNGWGVYYSFASWQNKFSGPGVMTKRNLSEVKVSKLLNYGLVDGYDRKYTRSLVQWVPNYNAGRAMYIKGEDYKHGSPHYNALLFNCTHLANEILRAGGLVGHTSSIPNSAFNRLEEYLGSSRVKVTRSSLLYGDLNGDNKVSVTDLSKLKLHLVRTKLIDYSYWANGDLNGDGNISVTDLNLMKQFLVGIISKFPAAG